MPEQDYLDPFNPSSPSGRMARLLDDVDELGYLERRSRARRMATQLDAVRLAEQHPEVMVDLVDEATRVDGEWAVRATVADLSARANVSEQTVYVEIRRAETLQRTPGFWNDFQTGTVSVANMLALAEVLDTLPSDAGVDAEMDAAAVVAAQVMPGRFRSRMRAVRERLHPESLERRSRAAAERRCARMQPAEDGMAWYGVFGPAAAVAEVDAHVDARARHLAEQHDETRTLDQIRAEVALALLCSQGDGEASVTVELGLMVPVLTLLGRSDEPARLEGYGPIDVDTARELAGRATSFVRVLTHPVTGTILDIDRSKHRPPADLQRWVRVRDQACSFLGCGRRAAACDIDHTVAWARGAPRGGLRHSRHVGMIRFGSSARLPGSPGVMVAKSSMAATIAACRVRLRLAQSSRSAGLLPMSPCSALLPEKVDNGRSAFRIRASIGSRAAFHSADEMPLAAHISASSCIWAWSASSSDMTAE